jgi:hypothetical protein
MAINFPNAPANGAIHTEGTVQWQFSASNKSWTMITTGDPGIDNATNNDNVLVGLNRITVGPDSFNVQVPATGLTFDPALRLLKVNANASQLNNLLEIRTSADALLNAFNQRGVLQNAGRVFFTDTTPTVNAADTGQLWFDTTVGATSLKVWNGSAWVSSGGGVDLTSNQVISGAKTFSNNIFLSSTAKLSGSGVSKSVVIAPTNGSGVAVDAITATSATTTVNNTLEFSAVGTNAKTAVVTLADAQTISGAKTLTSNLRLDVSGGGKIFASPLTDSVGLSNDLFVQPNLSSAGRSIRLFSNSSNLPSTGITIRPKNGNNVGELVVDGTARVSGDLVVTGAIQTAGSLAAASVAIGSFKSQNGTAEQNVTTTPSSLSTLTFTISEDVTTFTGSTLNVVNNGSTAVAFYWRREQWTSSNAYAFVVRKVTLQGNSSCSLGVNAGTFTITSGSATNVMVGGRPTSMTLAGVTDSPIVVTLSLAST